MRQPEEFWVCENAGEICRGEPGHVEELDECEVVDLLNEQHSSIAKLKAAATAVADDWFDDRPANRLGEVETELIAELKLLLELMDKEE